MQSLGWGVGATEIDTEKVDTLRAIGVDARTPDLFDESPGWAGKFDAVTCWHVLEHIHDSEKLIRQAWDALRPGGYFDVAVPDFGSPQARRWGQDWFGLDVPRHIVHFSRANLNRVLEWPGFEVMQWRATAIEYDLFGEIQSSLNVGAKRKNELFEALTGDRGTENYPAMSRRAILYTSAILRAFIALPRFTFEALRGAGGTLWVTCRKPQ